MALEDTALPNIKPLGSPSGRFDASPLAETSLGNLQATPDTLAGEDIGGIAGGSNIPLLKNDTSISGRHDMGSSTYGTGGPTQLSQNDPFGDI
jgi:hypothetical protein